MCPKNPFFNVFSHAPHYVPEEANYFKRYSTKDDILLVQKLGLRDRGILSKGMYVCLVIFDSEKIADKATYLQP